MVAGEDASRNSWAYLAGAGVGVVYLVVLIQRFRRRAVDPDRQDPARHIALMAKCGCPALAVAAGAAICIALDQQWIAGPFIVLAAIVLAAAGIIALAIYLWELAEARRIQTRYVIREASYADAPRHRPGRADTGDRVPELGRPTSPWRRTRRGCGVPFASAGPRIA